MPDDEQLLRQLGQEILRLTTRRTTSQPGSLLEHSAFRILWLLVESGPRSLRELSAELHLERSTVNRQVNAAIRHGHVERFETPGRPVGLVRPTPQGRKAYLHDGRLRAAVYARALDGLGSAHAATVVAGLGGLNDALDRALDGTLADMAHENGPSADR